MTATLEDHDTYTAPSAESPDEAHYDPEPATTSKGATKAEPKADAKSKAASRQKERDRATRANLREGARKALEVQAAPADVRRVVASIASCEDDVVEITVALAGPRNDAFTVIKDLGEISDEMTENPIQAGIRIMGMEPEQTRSLWKLLETAGADLPARQPANDMKAAMTLAEAIQKLTDQDRKLLAAASALAG
ncbi:hypothetical protein LG293_16340 (plasmid) [Citricoccus nitrophenolicus]